MDITEHNPWWFGDIDNDPDIKKWKMSEIRWIPRIVDEIGLQPFALHILLGPRQVGKTTALKLLIKKLIDSGANPFSIFYFNCDILESYKELSTVIKSYFKIRASRHIDSSIIILDEITYPAGWFRAIKHFIDSGKFAKDVIILSGSLSAELRGEVETFPGRRGNGRDYYMYPISFREFLKIYDERLYSAIREIKSLSYDEIKKFAEENAYLVEKLNDAFDTYLEAGGFPRSIISKLTKGFVERSVLEDYLRWIRGDIIIVNKSRETAKRIARAIIEKSLSRISWHAIAKDYDIPSHATVREYIEMFQEMIIAKILYHIDPNKGIVLFRKNKKVHLIDPFYYRLFEYWTGSKLVNRMETLYEATLIGHLARDFPTYYWSNSYEVDAVVKLNNRWLSFEVTIGRVSKKRKYLFGSRTIVVTRESIDAYNYIIPLSILLAGYETANSRKLSEI